MTTSPFWCEAVSISLGVVFVTGCSHTSSVAPMPRSGDEQVQRSATSQEPGIAFKAGQILARGEGMIAGGRYELISIDLAGNLTYDGTSRYTYDAWNRLVGVAQG